MSEDPGPPIVGTLHSVGDEGVVRLKARYAHDLDDTWSALTRPERLAHWFGKVEGELRTGGEFRAFVSASEWDGRGRIDACVPQQRLEVTMWEEEGKEHTATAELIADGRLTGIVLEVRRLPLEFVWAYGAGWQVHLEDLGAHLSGKDNTNSTSRWDELEPLYRSMSVVPLED
jgi:uncharacterized protein YndB with AHSA1/START domain